MDAAGAGPMRTCIGCRQVGPAAQMVRLRLVDGRLSVGRGPGRGASLHPQARCLAGALRPGVLPRAFKCQVSPPADEAAFARLIGTEHLATSSSSDKKATLVNK